MERIKRKAINFDLDTNEMKSLGIYPDGYRQLGKSFEEQGFSHRQGSGYVSKGRLSNTQVIDVIDKIVAGNAWLVQCVKKIDVTDIGRQHDLTAMVKRFGAMQLSHNADNVNTTENTEKKLSPKDEKVLSIIRASNVGAEFNSLYEGKVSTERSKADKRLMAIVQLFTNGDDAQSERIFESSALYSEAKGLSYVKNLMNAVKSTPSSNSSTVRARFNGNVR